MEINDPNEPNINDHQDKFEETPKDFPQYLCKTCGKCCRSITTGYSYEQLQEMAEKGIEEAKVFIDIFKAFPDIDEARKVVPEQVEQVLSILEENKELALNEITFYYCPHITDESKCSIYEVRPNCCRRAPRNGWSAMPPGCGFEGWQFEQREKQKKMVRAVKEHLYMVETLSKDGKVPGKDITVEEFRETIMKKIEPWEKFGSLYW